ncbi:MAG: transporter associated domain-containing protein, partial [Planctomycetota bacterium]
MTQGALLLVWVGSLLAASAAALGARALRAFSRSELQDLCEKRDRLDRFGEILRQHEATALGVELFGSIASGVFAVSAAFWAIGRSDATQPIASILPAIVGVGLAMAALRVAAPWAIARVFAEPLLCAAWPLLRLAGAAVEPLRWAAGVLDAVLHRLAGRDPAPIDEQGFNEEIRSIVTEGHREGRLEEEAREMIEGVIELSEDNVAAIMTPRTDMHMLQVDLPWDELVQDVVRMGHTRIPVYGESKDDVAGILYVKDLIAELARPDAADRQTVRELARKPIFVPEAKKVDDLLQMFQQERTHIALVLDEYGGLAGLVTIEDVLEEIVGEIVDEYDQEEEEEIHDLGEGVCEALGRVRVDELNDALRIELPEDADYDTIGGFVFTELGRVPVAGERVDFAPDPRDPAVRVTVLAVNKRRIERVR